MHRLAQAPGRRVRIFGQQKRPVVAARDVGLVYAGVGADKAQTVLDDQKAGTYPQHLGRFTQNHLDQAGVFVRLPGQLQRARRRNDVRKVDQASLGFADHLLRQHQDVVVLKV